MNRDRLAEVLAKHQPSGWAGVRLACRCGATYPAGGMPDHQAEVLADLGVDLYPAELVTFLQGHRRDTLRAIRNCHPANTSDYHRWQGHAELARQLLERLGAEVPR